MTPAEFAAQFGQPAAAAPPASAMSPTDFATQFSQPAAAPAPAAPAPADMLFDPVSGLAINPADIPPPAPDPTAAARAEALRGVNTATTAPPGTRFRVGLSDDPATRLARLRQDFPSAEPVPGTDNFTYVDPGTGARQTYKPMGWSWPTLGRTAGALASVAPNMAAEVGGGLLGAAGGTAVGGPGVGTVTGAGLGAVSAKEALDRGLATFLGLPDERSTTQQLLDAGVTGVTNAVLPALTGAAGRFLLGPGVGTPVVQAARSLSDPTSTLVPGGVAPGLLGKLPLGVATQAPGWQRTEAGLLQTPFGAAPVTARYAQTGEGLRDAVQNLTGVVAPTGAPTADGFSGTVGDIANDILGRTNAQGAVLKNNLSTQLGNAPVDFTTLRSTLAQLKGRLRVAPESGADVLQPSIDFAQKIINDADARGGSLPFSTVLQQRTQAGAIPDWLTSGGAGAQQDAGMKQVYNALRTDLYDTANSQLPQGGGAPLQALRDYDNHWQSWMDGPKQAIDSLANESNKGTVLQNLMTNNSVKAQADFATLWNAATPEQKGLLQAGTMNTLGDTPNGFDMATFVRNYARLNSQQKGVMFGSGPDTLGDALDNLSTVQNAIKEQLATRGHSNTASVLLFNHLISGLGGVGGALHGGLEGGITGMALPLTVPYGAARLLQSRPFVNALSGAGLAATAGKAGWYGDAVGRLAAAGQADPGITALVNQYVQGLPPEPQPQQPGATQ